MGCLILDMDYGICLEGVCIGSGTFLGHAHTMKPFLHTAVKRNPCIAICCARVYCLSQRVHVANNWVLGIWVIVIIVQVLGKYMIIGYMDP